MRLSMAVVIVCLAASAVAYAQSPPAQTPPNATIQSPTAPAAAIPVQAGKRFACQTAAQGFNGQDRRDQMQLCMAQAHLDCLKQAIDQKNCRFATEGIHQKLRSIAREESLIGPAGTVVVARR